MAKRNLSIIGLAVKRIQEFPRGCVSVRLSGLAAQGTFPVSCTIPDGCFDPCVKQLLSAIERLSVNLACLQLRLDCWTPGL